MKYEIWNEGYADNGGRGEAQYLGTYESDSFQSACKKALIDKKWNMEYYDEKHNTYWGCRFFNNAGDARMSFG